MIIVEGWWKRFRAAELKLSACRNAYGVISLRLFPMTARMPHVAVSPAWVLGALMTGRAKQNDLGLWSLETWNVEAATGKAKEAF